ncbi:hypothetical protein CABS01_16204 [Colletotrichum abscissum]|uniref:uncharacterized protein n=1 Tax=Colletotrichum abscissum TaxID=1671311 RepID=UPI0027D5A7C5|nr:uncharacterized protein CABS01_16204 [Colletotrichum abscissum]KAK1472675.1 hypothetical protein CABS01_16204 [Colletotrichum abscissum]
MEGDGDMKQPFSLLTITLFLLCDESLSLHFQGIPSFAWKNNYNLMDWHQTSGQLCLSTETTIGPQVVAHGRGRSTNHGLYLPNSSHTNRQDKNGKLHRNK